MRRLFAALARPRPPHARRVRHEARLAHRQAQVRSDRRGELPGGPGRAEERQPRRGGEVLRARPARSTLLEVRRALGAPPRRSQVQAGAVRRGGRRVPAVRDAPPDARGGRLRRVPGRASRTCATRRATSRSSRRRTRRTSGRSRRRRRRCGTSSRSRPSRSTSRRRSGSSPTRRGGSPRTSGTWASTTASASAGRARPAATRRLVERYPGSRHEAEALMKMARAYLKVDEKHRARERPAAPHREAPAGRAAAGGGEAACLAPLSRPAATRGRGGAFGDRARSRRERASPVGAPRLVPAALALAAALAVWAAWGRVSCDAGLALRARRPRSAPPSRARTARGIPDVYGFRAGGIASLRQLRYADVAVNVEDARARVIAVVDAEGDVSWRDETARLSYVGREVFGMTPCRVALWCGDGRQFAQLRGVLATLFRRHDAFNAGDLDAYGHLVSDRYAARAASRPSSRGCAGDFRGGDGRACASSPGRSGSSATGPPSARTTRSGWATPPPAPLRARLRARARGPSGASSRALRSTPAATVQLEEAAAVDDTLKQALALGRGYYLKKDYAPRGAVPHADRRAEPVVRRRLQHARRHLPRPGAVPESAARLRGGAAHQPRVHGRRAEPRRHVQRHRQVQGGAGDLPSRALPLRRDAREARPLRPGEAREHVRRHRRRLLSAGRYEEAIREYRRALELGPPSWTSAPSSRGRSATRESASAPSASTRRSCARRPRSCPRA